MKLNEIKMLTEGPWRKVGNHKGVLVRTTTPEERRKAEEKAKQKSKERYAKSKESKLEDLRTEPIPDMTTDEIENLFKADGTGIGGEIGDISSWKRGYKTINGVSVASVSARLYIEINLKDMYDDETIKTMYDGRDKVEDSLNVTIYRDPKDPKKFHIGY